VTDCSYGNMSHSRDVCARECTADTFTTAPGRIHDTGVSVSPGLKSTYDGLATSDYASMHDADLALVRVASPGVG